ncbi:hypothetical protein ACOSP7_019959 [Xanthoceras sorbifolium]
MKLFSWMQTKLNGKQVNKKPNAVPATYPTKQGPREEFNDWPHGLLAIGTFGNNNEIKENNNNNQEIQNIDDDDDQDQEDQEETSSSMDLQDFTPEEIGKFEKALTKLLRRSKTVKNSDQKENIANGNLPLDRFLNCPSSLEVDRRISNALCSSDHDKVADHDDDHHQDLKDEDIDRTISVILGRCKDIRADNYSKKAAIGKKSISFLLKKMFVCRSGFAPQPSLRDTLQESRMERFLRIMLHKKINAQNNASRAQSLKRYLEDGTRQISRKGINEEEQQEKNNNKNNNNNNNDGYKWVKTDAEYIVLEI